MSIATRIQAMEEHISDAYNSLSKFGVAAPSNKNIENIASLVDEIYDNTPKTDYASGTNLTLENTRVGKIDFKDTDNIEKIGFGATNQYTTGKNKLAIKQLTTQTINGVTFTPHYTGNKLDYINVNGTASGTASYVLDNADVDQVSTYTNELPGGTYILDDFSGSSSVYTAIFFRYYTSGTTFTTINSVDNSRKFTINSTFKYASYIRIASGQNVNNMKFYPQLEIGSTETTYEPYTGGIVVPNPSDPQNINVVSGYNEIKIININKLPSAKLGTYTSSQMTHTCDGKGVYTFNGTANAVSSRYWEIEPYTIQSGDYLYLGNFVAQSGVSFSLWENGTTEIFALGSSTFINRVASLNDYVGRTVTLVRTYSLAQTLNNLTIKPMICNVNTLTDFIEHQEKDYEINLGKNLIEDETFVQGALNESTGTKRISCRNIKLKANTTYTLSSDLDFSVFNIEISTSANRYPTSTIVYDSGWKTSNITFTTGANDIFANIMVKKIGELVIAPSDVSTYHFQIEVGSAATSYTPYFSPIELCQIGQYQDYIYKNGKNWYIHKEIGKVIWNGTENWTVNPGISTTYVVARPTDWAYGNNNVLFNYFKIVDDLSTATEGARIGSSINLKNPNTPDLASFKTWLTNNNVYAYYPSTTSTEIPITNENLITQLDAWYNAQSMDDITYITVDGDLPIQLKLKALKK